MRMIRLLLMCVAVVHLAGAAQAEMAADEFPARYPKGAIDSVAMADRALAEAREARSRIETRYAEEVRTCHTRFFVTACMDEAKERRRTAILPIRPVELEASAFKRKQRIVLRDQALEARQARDNEQSIVPKINPNIAENVKVQETLRETAAAEHIRLQADVQERQAIHAAKLQQQQEDDARNAAQRAKNITAYQAKLRASEARQKRVAEKRAEKQRRLGASPVTPAFGNSSD